MLLSDMAIQLDWPHASYRLITTAYAEGISSYHYV